MIADFSIFLADEEGCAQNVWLQSCHLCRA